MDKEKDVVLDDELDDDLDGIDYNDQNAVKLESRFEGCTHHIVYKCPCGKGRITEGRVPGFGDYWALIECKECDKKYKIKTGCGYFWELEER